MFNAKTYKLDIFEDFRIDWGLPKHAPRRKKSSFSEQKSSTNDGSVIVEESDAMEDNRMSIRSTLFNWASDSSGDTGVRLVAVEKKTLLNTLWNFFKREPKPSITIEQFFTAMKGSTQDLKFVAERAAGYEAALLKARQGGQTALLEQLTYSVSAVRGETHLLDMKLTKFLDEKTVIDFVRKAKNGLRLDWVANFTRVIPDDLLMKKKEADRRLIFDNYAVMHYDPQGKSWAETEAEKARKRDPILFGLIKGRRRLYYIGDWVDEFCDLTLDQIADTLGRDPTGKLEAKVF